MARRRILRPVGARSRIAIADAPPDLLHHQQAELRDIAEMPYVSEPDEFECPRPRERLLRKQAMVGNRTLLHLQEPRVHGKAMQEIVWPRQKVHRLVLPPKDEVQRRLVGSDIQ